MLSNDPPADWAKCLADAITDGVTGSVYTLLPGKQSNRPDHVWCSALSAACKTYDDASGEMKRLLASAGRHLATQAVDALTESVMQQLSDDVDDVANPRALGSPSPKTQPLFKPSHGVEPVDADKFELPVRHVLEASAEATGKAGGALAATALIAPADAAMLHVRLVGALSCPDPSVHPAVVKYCVWPLLTGPFGAQLKAGIRSQIVGWLDATVPGTKPTSPPVP